MQIHFPHPRATRIHVNDSLCDITLGQDPEWPFQAHFVAKMEKAKKGMGGL